MQFKISKTLVGGRFFVRVETTDFTEADQAKANTFGEPTLLVKLENGKEYQGRIKAVGKLPPYGFYQQEEADQYAENLKLQISELKKRWDNLKDTWSNEEII